MIIEAIYRRERPIDPEDGIFLRHLGLWFYKHRALALVGNLCIVDDYTMEHTFILIKPDGVHLGLAGQIISKLEKKDFMLKGLKMITLDRTFAEKHHQDMSDKPVFSRLVNYIISGPVVAMVWEGTNAVSTGRKIIRKTIPTASDLDRDIGSTLIHGSDSLESAYKEIALWFPDGPVKGPEAVIPIAGDIGRNSVMGLDTMEQTLIMIMPDGVKSGLVGQIIRRFNNKGFTLKGLKMIIVDRIFAEKHYQHLSAKPFFSDRVNYISSGPLVAMIWEGKSVVSAGSDIIGNTIPCNDMDTDIGSTLIHWSDSLESTIKETALWFPDGPVKAHSDAAKPKARDIGRISVTGFDSGVPREDVESALREHFSSCGKITDVYFFKKLCAAYIYFVGEGAVNKALKLSGIDVGGWKICAKAYPFDDDSGVTLIVKGYSTSLTDAKIKTALEKLFSSCGTVTEICTLKGFTTVEIEGYDAAEKALRLSGSNIGRHKLLVKILTKPPRHTVHNRRTWFKNKMPAK